MNIIVIGDAILDINNTSQIYRNAPEANIPIYYVSDIDYTLGGAANVCYNFKNLHTNVELVSVIGNDACGITVKDILTTNQISHKLFTEPNRKTTQKNRIFIKDDIQVRFDIEDAHDISTDIADEILAYITTKENIHAIVISDYDKGVISEYLCTALVSFANQSNIPTFIDPKIKNYKKYLNCFFIKPNLAELNLLTGLDTDIEVMLSCLKTKLNCTNILLTLSKDGMLFFNKTSQVIKHDTTINLIDVTGSGDVVLAVVVYSYLKDKDFILASETANYIAGKGVTVIGNYVTTLDDITEYNDLRLLKESKIIYDTELHKINALSRKPNVIFTNGCFDILHSAHIKLLQFSKKLGDTLVVGLNSDNSIKQLKGTTRPINDLNERSNMLSLFDFIDYIIVFDDTTPYNIIHKLKPCILVKGSDYKKTDVVGNDLVQNVVLFDLIPNKSSTNIISKIKNM
jgi:D-beta-D-heptose 7-phosphate kinase/D-beta-D-heptose 1-phosphate adenosyltransferase